MALFCHPRSTYFWLTLAFLKLYIQETEGFQNSPISQWSYQHQCAISSSSTGESKTKIDHYASPSTTQGYFERRALLRLHAHKLWDRLEIEEDPEPFWYLINCVAGLEIDLLRQCREVCRDMPDAVKFVVPTEKKTRSHGANRMVTETKVKYQGYVFAKLRLCPEVYEAIQGLDLCRSWMGTVNRKGYRKLPPAPVALNELEVESFGLEDVEFEEEEPEELVLAEDGQKIKQLIVDEPGIDSKNQVDQEAVKAFLGLQVEDMVKVTKPSQFYNEDGIIRRLKDGKILVRFYTYGSMYEQWMDPSDVRKLNEVEVLRGLSGPTQPITQRDFDRQINPMAGGRNSVGSFGGDGGRNSVGSFGGDGARNRRQDRVSRGQTNRGSSTDSDWKQAEKDWDWYKEQRESKEDVFADDEWTFSPGSKTRDNHFDDDATRRVRTPTKRDKGSARQQSRNNNGDWSSFVSTASVPGKEEDDFFASLMSDIEDFNGGDSTAKSKNAVRTNSGSEEDNFFASLLSQENEANQGSADDRVSSSADVDDFFASLAAKSGDKSATDSLFDEDDIFSGLDFENEEQSDDSDDFFRTLENELGSALENKETNANYGSAVGGEEEITGSDDEDFFADLGNTLFSELDENNEDEGFQDEGNEPAETEDDASATAIRSADHGDLNKLTVDKLKEMLRARGMKVSGKKAELIERLSG